MSREFPTLERRWRYYHTRRVFHEIGYQLGRALHVGLFLLGCFVALRWLARYLGWDV